MHLKCRAWQSGRIGGCHTCVTGLEEMMRLLASPVPASSAGPAGTAGTAVFTHSIW